MPLAHYAHNDRILPSIKNAGACKILFATRIPHAYYAVFPMETCNQTEEINIKTRVPIDLYLSFEEVAKNHGLTYPQALAYVIKWAITKQSLNPGA
jgi:hypothetical protein